MEPGVPFSLLGAVQLLAIAAGVGLAAAAVLRRTAAGAVLAVGALLLTSAEVATALRIGDTGSDGLAVVRGVAGLLLAVGFATGGLGQRRPPPALYGVVVPLAAGGGPALFAGAAALVAAASAARTRRDAIGAALGSGLVLWGASSLVSVRADHGSAAPTTVLLLRGGGALLVLVGLALLARSSLLSKVVGAILAGVIAMAVAAVAVVGNVVVDSYDTQARQTVQDAAAARQISLLDYRDSIVQAATRLGAFCDSSPAAECLRLAGGDEPGLPLVPDNVRDFLVRVYPGGAVQLVHQRDAGITTATLLGMRSLPAVQQVLRTPGKNPVGTAVRLQGERTAVALAGVVGHTDRANTGGRPAFAYVYGVVLDQQYAQDSVDEGGFGLFFLAGDPLAVVASNKSAAAERTLLGIARRAHVADGVPADGLTVGSEGVDPTVAFRPLTNAVGDVVGTFAITRDPGPALQAERDALRLLVLTSLAALLLVAVLAVALGRRTVDPVRRLTLAAERVSAGDLTVTTGVRTRDEVGTLATRFDAMTSSLGRLTGDLRDAAARLSTVLASMTDGLLATDADGVVTSVNRAALQMLGLEEADVVGEPLGIVADVRDPNGAQLADPALRPRDEAAEVVRPDGSRVPVRVAITPLQGADGVVVVLRDTTREREVERMKTEFLSNVSHELRTPLTPIRGYAEILVSKPGLDSDKVLTFATTIRDESVKMNRVVDLLVDVAALEAGRVSVTPRTISARDLLDTRLEAWQRRAPERSGDLKRRVAGGLPLLHVDPTWVGKALDELVDNAVKYTPAGTAITLLAEPSPEPGRVRVTVKDAGPGIPEADQAGLFTSFEQVDGSATRKVGGLGLGLSFVRRLAEDAGLPLTVSSTAGRGAEFSLDLPVADDEVTAPEPARSPRRASRAAPR